MWAKETERFSPPIRKIHAAIHQNFSLRIGSFVTRPILARVLLPILLLAIEPTRVGDHDPRAFYDLGSEKPSILSWEPLRRPLPSHRFTLEKEERPLATGQQREMVFPDLFPYCLFYCLFRIGLRLQIVRRNAFDSLRPVEDRCAPYQALMIE